MSQQEQDELRRKPNIAPYERVVRKDDYRFAPHILLNASRPELSPLLLGPLPETAGGWGACEHRYTGTSDPDYQTLLAALQEGKRRLDETPIYGTPDFRPNRQYIREMVRFGVLGPEYQQRNKPIDFFQTDQQYWKLFWCEPKSENKWAYLE
jgi:hypothetical protein